MLEWQVTAEIAGTPVTLSGRETVPEQGPLLVERRLPKGVLAEAVGVLPLAVEPGDAIFMNGYQSWTSCPERGIRDRIRSLRGLPRFYVERQGLDRYGDYYFVSYPDKPGLTHGFSWCYFRRGDRFRLIASLDETAGYTIFRYDSGKGRLTVERDCAGLAWEGPFPVFQLYFAEGSEQEVFDGWFHALGIDRTDAPPLRGYCSWYERYQAIDQTCLRADLRSWRPLLSPGDLFLIDDGWERAVGDWLTADSRKFPRGLGPLVEEIHSEGLRAGLWLAPFAVQRDASLAALHPEWLVRRDGEIWRCGGNWGGFYALDIDEPEVMDHLRRVLRRVLDEWGFDLVKLDFLYCAALFGTDRESRAARMIRAMDALRELCGDKLLLACGVPLMPAFGRADYCRIGPDMGLDWDGSRVEQRMHRERVSTKNSLLNTIARRQLDGRAFRNDPDVFFLREEDLRLTREQKQLAGQVNALLGGALLCSDDASHYWEEQRDQYRELTHLLEARDVRVDSGGGYIRYVLDGQKHLLSLPEEWFR